MIKIDNNVFYISAGEACYIFRIEDGAPIHTYFGKRVEPEDDLSALGCGGKTKELYVQAVIDGKKKDLDFAFVDAWVATDDDGNDKSLVVELCDEKSKLNATMYYTPHPRGGIYRRVTIKHTDVGDVQLALVRQSVGCSCAYNVDGNNKGLEFFATVGGDNGDAYGFLCANADGSVAVKHAVDGITAACEIGAPTTIYDFDTAECPELLCVYSDIGKGGMSRIFHDILRGDGEDEHLSERAAVLFLPKMKAEQVAAAVKVAGELGFGVVALDGGKHTKDDICALGSACKESGLVAGLRVRWDVPYSMVAAAVEQNDIRYAMIDAPNDGATDKWRSVFAMRNILKAFNGLRVDLCMATGAIGKAFTVCYPLGFVRNVINPDPPENFKTRFDGASLGALGYELDPIELSDGIKRAVRGQILSYQDDARCVLRGDIYSYGDGACRMAVRKDKSRAYAVCVSKGERIKLLGLDEHNLYHVRELNKTFSGAALVHCGIAVGEGTHVFHVLQVADY